MKRKVMMTLLSGTAVFMLGGMIDASAKKLDDRGRLVSSSGKVVKGYHVFDGKLYKDGVPNKGYALVGKGKQMKLY